MEDLQQRMNLMQRLVCVMRDVGAVGKGGTTTDGPKFDYFKIDDVVDALRRAFVAHGVVVVPVKIEDRKIEHFLAPSKYGEKFTWYAEALVTLQAFNADDPTDTIQFVGWGQGIDFSDKATGKAQSYAMKSAYLAAFQMRGQPDIEEDDIERDPAAQQQKPGPSGNQLSSDKPSAFTKAVQVIKTTSDPSELYEYAKLVGEELRSGVIVMDATQNEPKRFGQYVSTRLVAMGWEKKEDGKWGPKTNGTSTQGTEQ